MLTAHYAAMQNLNKCLGQITIDYQLNEFNSSYNRFAKSAKFAQTT